MFACCKKSTANVVDGALVVSLPGAENPCVWKMDMSRVHSAALEMREEKGKFVLGVKGAKGEVTDIATFEKKKQAANTLNAISRALIRGGKGKGRKWWKIIGGTILVLFLLMLLFGGGPNPGGNFSSSKMESGKPLPAEELLGK